MATIELKNDYRLRSDSKQWIFEKKTNALNEKTQLPIFSPVGFYPTLEGAVKRSFDYFIRQSDANGVIELMQVSKELIAEYTSVFSPNIEIKGK